MLDETDRIVLARIDERVAGLCKTISDHLDDDKEEFEKLHLRVNGISRGQAWILGVGAGVGSAFSIAVVWAKDMVGH